MKKFTHLVFTGLLTLSPLSFISAQTTQLLAESGNFETLEQVNIKRTGFFKPKFTLGKFYTTKVGFIRRNTIRNWGIFTKFQSSIRSRFKFDMTNNQNLVAQTRCIITSHTQHVPFKPEIALGVVENAFEGEIIIQNKEKWTFEIFNLQSIGNNPVIGYAYLENKSDEKIIIQPILSSIPILRKVIQVPAGLSFYYKDELIGQVDTYFNKQTMYYSKNAPENVQMLIANLSVAYVQFQNVVDSNSLDIYFANR
jgi:hypothetical protein